MSMLKECVVRNTIGFTSARRAKSRFDKLVYNSLLGVIGKERCIKSTTNLLGTFLVLRFRVLI